MEINKQDFQDLLISLQILKNSLKEAPVDFLGTGSNHKEADLEELQWNNNWKDAYINCITILEKYG